MEDARSLLPDDVNSVMSAPFFVIFWQLAIADISFSSDTYKRAIDRLDRMIKEIPSWRLLPSEKKGEIAKFQKRAEELKKEKDVQAAVVNGPNKRRLRSESSKWFGKGKRIQSGKR
jgi:THO complex subunit 2